MAKKKIHKDLVPKLLRNQVAGLASDEAWELVLLLFFEGEKPFNEIKAHFRTSPAKLTCLLDKARDCGQVEKYYTWRFSYYTWRFSGTAYRLSRDFGLLLDCWLNFLRTLTEGRSRKRSFWQRLKRRLRW